MNSTVYVKRTQSKPIDIFFRGVVDVKSKEKKVVFVDAFQVLNDRYLGRMNVHNYFAIAENSVRINELNLIAIEELKNYHLVMKENFHIPDNIVYGLPISTTFLNSDKDFEILLNALKRNGYKKGSVVLSFNGAILARLDDAAKKRYSRLRRSGYKTAVAQFGEDYNSLDIFAEFTFDYLRCEAKYFDATQNKKKLLAMLIKFCNTNKIGLIVEGVDSTGQLTRFKRAGVKFVTGQAVSPLSQWVTNEFLNLPNPQDEKLSAYMQKLQKELDARQKIERAELMAYRQASIDKAKTVDVNCIIPSAPRPTLDKSPYQIRLEQQKEEARKAIGTLIAKLPDDEQYNVEDETSLSVGMGTSSKDEIVDAERQNDLSDELNCDKGENADIIPTDSEGNAYINEQNSGVSAPVRPTAPNTDKARNKSVEEDLKKQAKLLNEYRSGGLFGGLGDFGEMLGVTLHIDGSEIETPPLDGSYNEKYQWVDLDGNVYNGYFDVDGKWIEYEQFDRITEGSYNDIGQWVDGDGKVYDGYFDEQGRWIDYTYTDQGGEIVDNGYFDDKINKWVPFGYFKEDGSYHRF